MNTSTQEHRATREKGFTAVEILVAMAVSSVLLAGVLQIYNTSRQTYRVTDALSRMQENARYAMDIMARDIRSGGLLGCGGELKTRIANALNGVGTWYLDAGALMGYEGGADTFPTEYASDALGSSDSLVLRRGNPDAGLRVAKHNPLASNIHLEANHDLQQGDILVMADRDCTQVSVFQMTSADGNNSTNLISHAAGSGTPGNCTGVLTGDWDCGGGFPTTPTIDMAYDTGSLVLPFLVNAYYIGSSASPGSPPALFREILSGAGTTAQELVEGVEDMQILFGEDTDDDRIANPPYVTADNVTDWENVVSVRVALLLRTLEDNVAAGQQTYNFDGASQTAADRRLRLAHSFTVNLRNRVP
jgi:type IV pilus assembly protein PilW